MKRNMYREKAMMELIKKALREKISLEEKALLDQWYREQETEKTVIRDRYGRKKEQVKNALFAQIKAEVDKDKPIYRKKERHFAGVKWAVAASLALLIAAGFARQQLRQKSNRTDLEESRYEVFENPAGMKRKIQLPDGSTVHLNHQSKISVYRNFSQKRLIKLEGEAFFEVARNESLPFTIHTAQLETVVLGTSFNISAQKGEEETVAVRSGKVRVTESLNSSKKAHLLQKNESLHFRQNSISITKISDPEKVFGWHEDKLVFRNASMTEMVKSLENWYGVRIESHGIDQSKSCEITGVYQHLTLEEVLEAIRYSLPIQYKIKHKNVKIEFNDC